MSRFEPLAGRGVATRRALPPRNCAARSGYRGRAGASPAPGADWRTERGRERLTDDCPSFDEWWWRRRRWAGGGGGGGGGGSGGGGCNGGGGSGSGPSRVPSAMDNTGVAAVTSRSYTLPPTQWPRSEPPVKADAPRWVSPTPGRRGRQQTPSIQRPATGPIGGTDLPLTTRHERQGRTGQKGKGSVQQRQHAT